MTCTASQASHLIHCEPQDTNPNTVFVQPDPQPHLSAHSCQTNISQPPLARALRTRDAYAPREPPHGCPTPTPIPGAPPMVSPPGAVVRGRPPNFLDGTEVACTWERRNRGLQHGSRGPGAASRTDAGKRGDRSAGYSSLLLGAGLARARHTPWSAGLLGLRMEGFLGDGKGFRPVLKMTGICNR